MPIVATPAEFGAIVQAETGEVRVGGVDARVGGGGAELMIRDGALDNPKVDAMNKPDVTVEYNFYQKPAGAATGHCDYQTRSSGTWNCAVRRRCSTRCQGV